MDEDEDRVDAFAGEVHRVPVGDVAPHDLDAVPPGPAVELRRGTRSAADAVSRGQQFRDESAADVAGGSEHEHVHVFSSSREVRSGDRAGPDRAQRRVSGL